MGRAAKLSIKFLFKKRSDTKIGAFDRAGFP
jgi:hypothetical protein